MTIETKLLGVILVVTVILLFGGVFLLTRGGSSSVVAGTSVVQIDYSKGQKIGTDSAEIRLVEFSDFQCPACAVAQPFVKKLRDAYPNQIQVIYRYFPLAQHPFGRQTAYLAQVAGEQGKFWEMHDKLFDTQTQWSGLNSAEATAFFLDLAKQIGLDKGGVKQAVEDPAIKAKIDDDIAEGRQIGVNSTPTFYLNGRKLNLQGFEDLNAVVAEELKK